MELLRFQAAEPMFVPALFSKAFVPGIQICHSHAPLSASSLQTLVFPQAHYKARVSFTLGTPLTGSCTVKQVHSATVLDASGDLCSEPADGLFFVHEKGAEPKTLAIRTADCLPVAIVAQVGETTFGALVHAGWRGFAAGIHFCAITKLLEQAERRGISRADFLSSVSLFVGPAIFGASYECDADVASALRSHYDTRIAPSQSTPEFMEIYDHCSNVALSAESSGFSGPFRQDRVYPDLQLLMCLDFIAAGVPLSKMQVLRENTWGSSVLHSYRFASVRGGLKDARIVTHLVLGS